MQALVADISTGFANLSGRSAGRADRQQPRATRTGPRHGGLRDLGAALAQRRPPAGCSAGPRSSTVSSEGSLLEESLLTWARPRLEQGEEVQIGDITDRPMRARDRCRRTPSASLLLLPLRVDGEVIGVLALQPRLLAGLVRPRPRRPAHDRRDHRHRVGAQADRRVDAPATRDTGPRQSRRQPRRTGGIDRARVEPAARGDPEQRGSRAAAAGPARSAAATNCARSSAT